LIARAVVRSRIVLFSLGVAFLASSLGGCRNRKEEARQKAELTKSLEQYQAQIVELQKQTSGIRARLDKLPEDLPGTETVRDDLHALEEGLGVEGGRVQWLSGQLDKAFASGNKQEIEAIRKAIPGGAEGMTQLMVKVTHELIPSERLASQRHFFEALDAQRAQEARKEAQKERPPKAR
jgi:Xaa-Pro aminopeptidase